MDKFFLLLLGFVLMYSSPIHAVKAKTASKAGPEFYVTTEDIILDIVFPTIDQKVQKEYSDDMVGWQWKRIVGMQYNDNHSYDVSVQIEVNPQDKGANQYVDDLVKLRISPSCDSKKINKMRCKHDFKIEILDYQHLSP